MLFPVFMHIEQILLTMDISFFESWKLVHVPWSLFLNEALSYQTKEIPKNECPK